MPLLQRGVAAVAKRMPKVISPKGHAIADFATIGLWGIVAGMLWHRNKRAAVGALICGAMELGEVLLTDFPGGIAPVISFPLHGKIDMGLAAATISLPNFLEFDDEPEARLFHMQGLNLTTVTALTDFKENEGEDLRRAA